MDYDEFIKELKQYKESFEEGKPVKVMIQGGSQFNILAINEDDVKTIDIIRIN